MADILSSTSDSDSNESQDKEEGFASSKSDDGNEDVEDIDSEDYENTEKSIHTIRDTYKLHLKEYKSENTIHIDASLKNGANADIGSLTAYLFYRGEFGNVNFWGDCDAETQETCDVALWFTVRNGRLKYDKIEGLDRETDQLASSTGGFLYLYELRLEKEERGKDLGLDMVETLLDYLGDRWTIAWVMPFSLTRDSRDKPKEEIRAGNIALARHYARLGFIQASTKEHLKRCAFWYLIPGRRTRKSKEDVKNLPVTFANEDSDSSTDEDRNILVKAVLGESGNGDQLKEITRLVKNGEDINKSEALFYAIASDKEDVVKHLLELGADISYTNQDGNSPLNLAANGLNVKICQLLLKLGADKDTANVNGGTPFKGAIEAIEHINKSNATFNNNIIKQVNLNHRVTQFENRSDKLVLLHLLSRNPLKLIEGILTPRMFYRLKVTAQGAADDCRISMPEFEKRVPMRLEDVKWQVHLLSRVPGRELPKVIYKSYAWGWQQQLQAIGNVMERGLLPTERRVQEELRHSDGRYNSHYKDKEKGGNLLHALVALVETARDESETEGDGEFNEIHGEDLEQIPAMEVLDDDFLFVHHFFVSYCVTPGATLVVPDIKISPSARQSSAPGSPKAGSNGVERSAPGSPKAGPKCVERSATGSPKAGPKCVERSDTGSAKAGPKGVERSALGSPKAGPKGVERSAPGSPKAGPKCVERSAPGFPKAGPKDVEISALGSPKAGPSGVKRSKPRSPKAGQGICLRSTTSKKKCL